MFCRRESGFTRDDLLLNLLSKIGEVLLLFRGEGRAVEDVTSVLP